MKKVKFVFIYFALKMIFGAALMAQPSNVSLKFDGTDRSLNCVTLPDLSSTLNGLSEFTVEFWYKRNGLSSEIDKYGEYFSMGFTNSSNPAYSYGFKIQVPNGNGFNLMIGCGDGTVRSYKRSDAVTDTRIGQWTHCAWVFKGATQTFECYSNGQLTGFTTGAGTIPTSVSYPSPASDFYLGGKLCVNLCDFRIWDKALDGATILANKDKFVESSANPNLIYNWRMDDMTDPSIILDYGPNKKHGTIPTGGTVTYDEDDNTSGGGEEPTEKTGRRVVGYYPSYRMNSFKTSQLQHLTDVVIFSVVPDPVNANFKVYETQANGTMVFANPKGTAGLNTTQIANVVNACKNTPVKTHLCIGGGDVTMPFKNLMNNGKETQFAQYVKDFCLDYGIDGVDIDWEFPALSDTAKVTDLLQALHAALSPEGLTLSVASANSLSSNNKKASILSAVRNAHLLEMINVMGYNHSMGHMYTDYSVFIQQYNVPAEKVIAGIPFFAYGPTKIPYFSLMSQAQAKGIAITPDMNRVVVDGKVYNLNGVNLVKEKTQYAIDKMGGIMIWETGQDIDPGLDLSLLKAVGETMELNFPTPVEKEDFSEEVNIYPNPASDHFFCEINGSFNGGVLSLYNLTGIEVLKKEISSGSGIKIPLTNLNSGVYVCVVRVGNKLYAKKVVVR